MILNNSIDIEAWLLNWFSTNTSANKDKIQNELDKILIRENRMKIANACFDFIKIRTDLDLFGWAEQDIFKH